MEDGVKSSSVLLLLLTQGTLGRPFCQQEIRWAKKYELTCAAHLIFALPSARFYSTGGALLSAESSAYLNNKQWTTTFTSSRM